MDTGALGVITAIGSAIAALGTVGALFAAIATLRYESAERRRSEVRGVRTVLDWGEPGWVEQRRREDPDFNPSEFLKQLEAESLARGGKPQDRVATVSAIGIVVNGTDESIYDVVVAYRPVKFFRMSIVGYRSRLEPGGTYELPRGSEMDERIALWDPEGLKPGVEAVFTDSRGIRWNRTTLGRLVVLKPLRWFAPWRIPHELDREELPFWAWRAFWHYRWADHSQRDFHRYPPVWWAVDIRWARWRYARKNEPVTIPPWRLIKRYKNRHSISASRFAGRLPLPWWAIDDRWRYWRSYRKSMAANRAQRKNYEANLNEARSLLE